MQLDQWSHYWQSGSLTSLPEDFSENYDGEIKTHWIDCFKTLDKEAKILDVCTGNGAIALHAQQFSDDFNKLFDVHATDGANVDVASVIKTYPHLAKTIDRIVFRFGAAVEDIDYNDNSFDLITSQYGIEYSNWDISAKNLSRMLKSGGSLCIVCHAPNTEITKQMKAEQLDYGYLETIGFFRDLDTYLSKQLSFSDLAKAALAKIPMLTERLQSINSPMFATAKQFYSFIARSTEMHVDGKRQDISKFYQGHLNAFKRLSDVLSVTDRIAASPQWYQAFISNNMQLISTKEIYQDGEHLAGISYLFQKK